MLLLPIPLTLTCHRPVDRCLKIVAIWSACLPPAALPPRSGTRPNIAYVVRLSTMLEEAAEELEIYKEVNLSIWLSRVLEEAAEDLIHLWRENSMYWSKFMDSV